MLLHLLSDLHLEFGEFYPPETDADVILLPGDIHLGAKGVEWAKATFKKPVIYVPGNHEFYRGFIKETGVALAAAAKGSNVHVLQDQAVIIDGVRFLGGTLWTDFNFTRHQPYAIHDAKQGLEDYRLIRVDHTFKKLHPRDTMLKHWATRSFIEEALSQPFDGKTVILSHHAPSALSVPDDLLEDDLTSAYASRLEYLFGPAVALWVHGHMHHSLDYTYNGTRTVCNPRGYSPKELNHSFDSGLILKI